MAKRGPPPRGEYANKTRVFSTRLREDTKQALQDAAAKSGRSLSQEVEHRLRRSFDEDRRMVDCLGGERNYAVLRLIASLMSTVHNPFRPDADWLSDAYQFDQLVKAVVPVLELFRPPGDRSLPTDDEGLRAIGDLQSGQAAGYAALTLLHAPDELPVNPKSPMARIKSSLGKEIIARIDKQPQRKLVVGTADDMRRAADELEKGEKK
jgi:TraY domain